MLKIDTPVIPIPTPFKEDESIDLDALENYIAFLKTKGIKAVMTTVGTSRYNLLNKEEIKQVNKVVAQTAGEEMISIVANPNYGSLKETLEIAKDAEKNKADIFLAYFPDRHYGDDVVYDFFQTLSQEVSIDIIIHEMPLRNGLGGGQKHYGIELLQRLFSLKNIIGLKEESLDQGYSETILKTFLPDTLIIGAGGGMSRYIRDYWLGASTYLGGIGNFLPEIELTFIESMKEKNFQKVYEIVYNIEKPYFEAVVPMGWHTSLKEALHILSLMPPYERKPLQRISVQDREILKEHIKQLEAKYDIYK